MCGVGPGDRIRDADVARIPRNGSFAAVVSASRIAGWPPRRAAAALTAAVRPGGAIAFAAPARSGWARYETAYRHFCGHPEFDVVEGAGYVIVFARRP